ncbi:unnamed protein product [Discula destructiva]
MFLGVPGSVGGAILMSLIKGGGVTGNLIHSSSKFLGWLTRLAAHLTGLGSKIPLPTDPALVPPADLHLPDPPEMPNPPNSPVPPEAPVPPVAPVVPKPPGKTNPEPDNNENNEKEPDEEEDDDLCDEMNTQARKEFRMDFPNGFRAVGNTPQKLDQRTSGFTAFRDSILNQPDFNKFPWKDLETDFDKIWKQVVKEKPEKYKKVTFQDQPPSQELLGTILQRYWDNKGIRARIGILKLGHTGNPRTTIMVPKYLQSSDKHPVTERTLWLYATEGDESWYQGLSRVKDEDRPTGNNMDEYWKTQLGTSDFDAFASQCLDAPSDAGKPSKDDPQDDPEHERCPRDESGKCSHGPQQPESSPYSTGDFSRPGSTSSPKNMPSSPKNLPSSPKSLPSSTPPQTTAVTTFTPTTTARLVPTPTHGTLSMGDSIYEEVC